ncbi:hypothetical protein [Actinomadura kijaniata]|uniref:hypothetical protein n=1 Tax=Actinomadura kijaniata TaxID=46161 RepID=UPI000833749C|nr:hypothetical protein [Actinomadura kijaniata]
MLYLVSWEIEAEASSPQAAAWQARAAQRRPGTTATVFTVRGDEGESQVDLCQDTGREMAVLQKMAARLGAASEDLDEAVHDALLAEASFINNSGLGEQLRCLVEQWGIGETAALLRDQARRRPLRRAR